MLRLSIIFSLIFGSLIVAAQTSLPVPSSDPQAVTLAQQSIAALSGGAPISDVTLNANAISVLGSDAETGTAILLAKPAAESRIDLSLNGGTRRDTRNSAGGVPAGEWIINGAAPVKYAQHNCWTDAAWFFPAFTSLEQTANPNFVFKYIGLEQHAGVSVQHVQVFQLLQTNPADVFHAMQLSAMDFYLNPSSFLPVALLFNAHADTDLNTDIATEVMFSNYQVTNGIPVPYHVQKLVNGTVVLDLTITSVTVNTGLSDAMFSMQ